MVRMKPQYFPEYSEKKQDKRSLRKTVTLKSLILNRLNRSNNQPSVPELWPSTCQTSTGIKEIKRSVPLWHPDNASVVNVDAWNAMLNAHSHEKLKKWWCNAWWDWEEKISESRKCCYIIQCLAVWKRNLILSNLERRETSRSTRLVRSCAVTKSDFYKRNFGAKSTFFFWLLAMQRELTYTKKKMSNVTATFAYSFFSL